MLFIDGSEMGGGGQILRTALSLSSILKTPFTTNNIRLNRPKPGLRPQHLTAVDAVKKISGAQTTNYSIGSLSLNFTPKNITAGDYLFDVSSKVSSAGSVTLIFQTLLPILSFAPHESTLLLKGGTHVLWSPNFHYLNFVFLPAARKMGINSEIILQKIGWYPKGGGAIKSTIKPIKKLKNLKITKRGRLKKIYCLAVASMLPEKILEREKKEAQILFAEHGLDPTVEIKTEDASEPGNMFFIFTEFSNISVGFSSLGKKGKPAEKVVKEAFNDFLSFFLSNAAVEKHLADQLLLYASLANGYSEILTDEITTHILSNIKIIEKFTKTKFSIENNLVSVEGIDFINESLKNL